MNLVHHPEQATAAAAGGATAATAVSVFDLVERALQIGCMAVAFVSGVLAIIGWILKWREKKKQKK